MRDAVWCVLTGRRRWQLLLEMIKDIVPFQGSKKEGELSKDIQTNFMENRERSGLLTPQCGYSYSGPGVKVGKA